MTEPAGVFWTQPAGVYQQPKVVNPPMGNNADNARMSIWHLGRPVEVEIYPSLEGWRSGNNDLIDDGRHDSGEPIVITIWAVVQPESSGGAHTVQQNREGERTEARIVLHTDSHMDFNLSAIEPYPELFPNGFRINGPDDDSAVDDRFNHSMIIRWRGRRFKCLEILDLYEGGDEATSDNGAIYRAVCGLYQHHSHERDAKPEDFVPEWGPQ